MLPTDQPVRCEVVTFWPPGTFNKRMARLTYCFSKRWANHRVRRVAVMFAHYNYCRSHRALKGHTPAMAHGLTTEKWTVRQLLENVTRGR